MLSDKGIRDTAVAFSALALSQGEMAMLDAHRNPWKPREPSGKKRKNKAQRKARKITRKAKK